MNIEDYTYHLPQSRIAYYPPKQRGNSRLLVLNRNTGNIEHTTYKNLASFLNPQDVLILNNTKVIKARLLAHDKNLKPYELLLTESHQMTQKSRYKHIAIYRGKLAIGMTLYLGKHRIIITNILDNGLAEIKSTDDLYDLAKHYGTMPLPPYIKRKANNFDNVRYQTIFATKEGSVAAPTASLNFTNQLQEKLVKKGVEVAQLTLHVGLGTFLPIRTKEVNKHHMHSEYFEIPTGTIKAIYKAKSNHSRVVALGTTVMRTIEFNAPNLINNTSNSLSGEADIFIYPGYKFQVADGLLTNFHAPKSTVLMMAAAFAGWDNLKKAYEEAIAEKYAFLSYGDSMLII